MIKIMPIPAFYDNYIWLIMHPESQYCALVDPGEATPVIKVLDEQQLTLTAILVTHHHHDHAGGITEILTQHPAPVFGPATESIPQLSHPVQESASVALDKLALTFQVLDIPAHTAGHIAYYGHGMVFCGDTLFTGGCGRLFEGTPQNMYDALHKLSTLPEETLIYCGHEYTTANLEFAKAVEPKNRELIQRIQDTQHLCYQSLPTVPSTLALEKQTNPFLRCHIPEVKQAAEQFAKTPLVTPVEVFTAIRQWKDSW